jgi:hypothetical protein
MTQQEIQERNKQIALMLGWEEEQQGSWFKTDKSAKYVVYSEHQNYPHKGLPFYRDWNWLHEAIEFIENLNNGNCYSVKIVNNKCEIYINTQYALAYDKHLSIFQKLDSKKEAVFTAVSDFAKLYNEGKL